MKNEEETKCGTCKFCIPKMRGYYCNSGDGEDSYNWSIEKSMMACTAWQNINSEEISLFPEKAKNIIRWARYSPNAYEVSTVGDKRFSALNARLRDGRSIEEAYQLDIKGYRKYGDNWRIGKGKPPIEPISKEDLYKRYLALWEQWAKENPKLITDLKDKAAGKVLTDKFAATQISQAKALADILNNQNF